MNWEFQDPFDFNLDDNDDDNGTEYDTKTDFDKEMDSLLGTDILDPDAMFPWWIWFC